MKDTNSAARLIIGIMGAIVLVVLGGSFFRAIEWHEKAFFAALGYLAGALSFLGRRTSDETQDVRVMNEKKDPLPVEEVKG